MKENVVLTGRLSAIALSILFHAVLLFAVSQTVVIHKQEKHAPIQPIKSFLYVPPKPKKTEPEKTIELEEKTKPEEKPALQSTDIPKDAEPKPFPIAEEPSIEPPKQATKKKPLATIVVTDEKAKKFSAYKQLDNLKNKLNEQIFQEEQFEFNRPNTGSIMHGTPTLVPHSTKQITLEEKKKLNTQQISSDMAITKGDDGQCTIERDLSTVGIEGVKSVEGFACGPSKQEKAFKAHMKNVLKKLGK